MASINKFSFLSAVKVIESGETVQSLETGCFFFKDGDSIRAVGGTRPPSFREFFGKWKRPSNQPARAKFTLEQLQALHKRLLSGESMTKIAASIDVEQPQLKAAFKNAGLLETKKYARKPKAD